ncbi:MAG: RecX family transcriptional regulator [Alphaproteobacteria bacterium]
MPGSHSRKTKPLPTILTPEKLERQALHYLERFATSTEGLRRVLRRKILLNQRFHPELDNAQAFLWIEDLIYRFSRSGLISDESYAEGRVAARRRRGDSAKLIRERLRSKGVPLPLIEAALADHAEDMGSDTIAELASAVNLARRRRLGPFRDPSVRMDYSRRDLSALARAGFSAKIARMVIEATDITALENLIPHASSFKEAP